MAADTIAEAYVTLRADLKALKADYQQAEKLTEKAAYSMELLGKKIGGIETSQLKLGIAAIGVAAIGMAKVSVDAFIEQEKSIAKLNAVLKATGDATGIGSAGMQQIASDMQEVTTYSGSAILNAEAILATFTKINDPNIFKETITASADLSTVMGQDLQSSVVQLGKALNDPIQGVAALKKVGVSFTVEQMKQIKAMQESGDLMGAQKLILAELKNEFGGAAEAVGKTFGGQLGILKEAINGAQEALGSIIADTLKPFLPIIKDAADGVKIFLEALAGNKAISKTDEIRKSFEQLGDKIKTLKIRQSELNPESREYGKIQDTIIKLEKQRADKVAEYTKVVQKSGEVNKKVGEENVSLTEGQIKQREEYRKIYEDSIASIGTKEEQLVQKFQNQMNNIKGDSKEAVDARYALELKLSNDLQEVWASEEEEYKALREKQAKHDNDWAENFKLHMEESSGANKTFFQQAGEAGDKFGSAMKGTFSNVFEDGLKGNLKNAADYFQAFSDVVVKIIADLAAEWVAKWAIMEAATAIGGGSATGAATTATAGAVAATTAGAAGAGAAMTAAPAAGVTAAQFGVAETAAPTATTTAATAGAGAAIATAGAIGLGVAAVGMYNEGQQGYSVQETYDAGLKGGTWSNQSIEIGKQYRNLKTRFFDLQNKTKRTAAEEKEYKKLTKLKAVGAYMTGEATAMPSAWSDFNGSAVPLLNKADLPFLRKKWKEAATSLGKPTSPIPFAMGGVVSKPTFAMIGEAGQDEAVLPLKRGSNGQLGVQIADSSMSTPTIVINADPSGFAKMLNEWSRTGRLIIDPRALRTSAAI